jgi:hypothetical protein
MTLGAHLLTLQLKRSFLTFFSPLPSLPLFSSLSLSPSPLTLVLLVLICALGTRSLLSLTESPYADVHCLPSLPFFPHPRRPCPLASSPSSAPLATKARASSPPSSPALPSRSAPSFAMFPPPKRRTSLRSTAKPLARAGLPSFKDLWRTTTASRRRSMAQRGSLPGGVTSEERKTQRKSSLPRERTSSTLPRCASLFLAPLRGRRAGSAYVILALQAAGVKHFVYSTLPSMAQASDGKYTHVTSWEGKYRIGKYAQEQLEGVTLVIPGSFFFSSSFSFSSFICSFALFTS